MKRVFACCLLFVLLNYPSFATNFYLSNNGNDLNSGFTPSDPWQSITQLNTALLQPGDSVLFYSGNIFRGQIDILNSGDETSPIYFGTYGGNDPAIISGALQASGWTIYSDNIYKSSFANTPSHLFADDQHLVIARYPNSGYLLHQQGTADTGFVDSALTQPDHYWDGAGIRMRTADRLYEYNQVSTFSNGLVHFLNNSLVNIENGYGYFLDNIFSELDGEAEWFFNSDSKTLYLYAPGGSDPNQLETEGSVYDFGISIQNGAGYIKIEKLQFEKQAFSGITSTGVVAHLSVDDCSFYLQGACGIDFNNGASYCEISGNFFRNIDGAAIIAKDLSEALISHNTISNIGLLPGYGINNLQQGFGISVDRGNGVNISENDIDSTGCSSININGNPVLAEKNNCSHSMLHFSNQGGIYSYGSNSDSVILRNNIIQHVIGSNEASPITDINACGIFLDELTNHYLVEGNTVAFATSYGIMLYRGGSHHTITGNLVYGCDKGQLCFKEGPTSGTNNSHVVKGNILYAIHENAAIASTISSYEDFAPAVFDSNYYFNPYSFFSMRRQLITGTEVQDHYYTLSQWRNFYGGDASSKETFFFRNRFITIDTIGENRIGNGTFNNNTDGWVNGTPDNLLLLLDNSTPLDNGCMKLLTTSNEPFNYGDSYYSGIPVDSGDFYQVGFSCYSLKDGNLGLFQQQFEFPNSASNLVRYFPFSGVRKNYQTVFQQNSNESECRLVTHLLFEDSLVWLDNISFYKVNAFYEEPSAKSRLYINNTSSPATYDLLDSIFYDLDQNVVSGQLTLAPYSSAVLVFDSSLITIADEPSQQTPAATILHVYPSITTVSAGINVVYNNQFADICTIEIYDGQGRLVFKNISGESFQSLHITLPSSLASGIYFITLHNKNHNLKSKFIIR
ncbi:MAG: right-handed parallel beta-helix repeat-containing protein [Chitinophagales bacterium]